LRKRKFEPFIFDLSIGSSPVALMGAYAAGIPLDGGNVFPFANFLVKEPAGDVEITAEVIEAL